MREIKFRVWIKKPYNLMVQPEEIQSMGLDSGKIIYVASNEHDIDRDTFEIMQYTGLKDESGVEIYEGDILKRRVHLVMYGTDLDEWVDEVVEVKWREDYAGFYIGESELFAEVAATTDRGTLCGCSKFEVIGNIYENPELLEGED